MNWTQYRVEFENVAQEDGGGYRVFFPTLGYAVYGAGDTLEETIASLEESKAAFDQFVGSTPGYGVPSPTLEDVRARLELESSLLVGSHSECCNNYAYAA